MKTWSTVFGCTLLTCLLIGNTDHHNDSPLLDEIFYCGVCNEAFPTESHTYKHPEPARASAMDVDPSAYVWIQGGDPTNWEDPANWLNGRVIPSDEAGASLIFSTATSGNIGQNPGSARLTMGSFTWDSSFDLDGFGSTRVTGCITIDTGSEADATATFTNGGSMGASYVTWQLNSNLILSGTGRGGKLQIRASKSTGVQGPGGFIVESGTLEFRGTHLSEDYTYTGGVTVRNGGLVKVDSEMGALGDGPLVIEEGGEVQAHNSEFDQDVTFVIESLSSENAFITRGGSNWNTSGTWTFDLSNAGTLVGNSWKIVDIGASASYHATDFEVAGFAEISPGIWSGLVNGAHYEFDETSGVLKVVAPTIPESISPSMLSLTPADDATDVPTNTELIIKFDEPINLKSGGTLSIIDLSDGSSSETITLPDPRATSPRGNDIKIALASYLQSETDYTIQINPDAVEDRSLTPNAFPGVTGNTVWNFRTEPADFIAPRFLSTIPENGATQYLPWKNLDITFDEAITLVDGGIITIHDLTDGSSTEAITLPDPRISSPNGNDMRIDLVSSLEFETQYAIHISADALADRAETPNAFAGIQDNLTWNFSTKDGTDEIHNVLLVAIGYDGRPPNRSIEVAEDIMFNDRVNINDGLRYASYNQMSLHLGDGSGLDPTVTFDYPASEFSGKISTTTLRDRAREDLRAMGYNLSLANYRFMLFIVPGGMSGFDGLAGTHWSIYEVFTERVIMHELGHNLGGNHSNGDPGCSLGWATWNYAPEKKLKFGWFDKFPEATKTLAEGEVLTLHPLHKDPSSQPGLRVASVEVPDLQDNRKTDTFHAYYMVSETPYGSFDPAENNKIFVTWDKGATLTSFRATLASGETFSNGYLSVTCKSVAADGSSAVAVIRLPDDPPEVDYQIWEAENNLPGDSGGSDNDNDGVKNFFEYLYNSDPNNYESSGFSLTAEIPEGGTAVNFVWSVADEYVMGEHYVVDQSEDLLQWDLLSEDDYTFEESTENGMKTLRVELTNNATFSNRFIRLRKP